MRAPHVLKVLCMLRVGVQGGVLCHTMSDSALTCACAGPTILQALPATVAEVGRKLLVEAVTMTPTVKPPWVPGGSASQACTPRPRAVSGLATDQNERAMQARDTGADSWICGLRLVVGRERLSGPGCWPTAQMRRIVIKVLQSQGDCIWPDEMAESASSCRRLH